MLHKQTRGNYEIMSLAVTPNSAKAVIASMTQGQCLKGHQKLHINIYEVVQT